MAGTFPQLPFPSEANFVSVWYSRSSETHSGRVNVRATGGHKWRLDLVYPPMNEEQARRIQAFYNRQRGGFGIFEYALAGYAPLGELGGIAKVHVSAGTGVSSVQTRGWPANRRVLKAGDMVRFQHSKSYQVVQPARANGSGVVALEIEPALRQDIKNGDLLITTGQTFRMSFIPNQDLDIKISPGYIWTIAPFSLVERF